LHTTPIILVDKLKNKQIPKNETCSCSLTATYVIDKPVELMCYLTR